MAALTPEQERLFIADLERMGVTRVRESLAHGTISPAFVSMTWDWLSEKERESEQRKEAAQSLQTEAASRASAAAERASAAAERAATANERQARAAESANKRATTAIIIAVASLIISAVIAAVPYWLARK